MDQSPTPCSERDGEVVSGVTEWLTLPTEIKRDAILSFEKQLLQREQIELPVNHFHADGVYLRVMYIPKGVCLTGKIHRHQHLNICTGDLSVLTEDGMRRFTGQNVVLSSVGIKRVGYAHEDTTWITVHHNPTNEMDLTKLEEMFVTDCYEKVEL